MVGSVSACREAAPGWGKGIPRPCRDAVETPSAFQAVSPLEEAELQWGWLLPSCCSTHSLEQAEDEGVEAHSMAGEFWELADFVVEAMQDLGGWAWEEDRLEITFLVYGALNSVWGPWVAI